MNTREPKEDDRENALKAAELLAELILLNPQFDNNIWVSGMMAFIFDAFSRGKVPNDEFRFYMNLYIDAYEELSKER